MARKIVICLTQGSSPGPQGESQEVKRYMAEEPKRRPIFVGGEWVHAGQDLRVDNPATGEVVAVTSSAGPEEYERAVERALAVQFQLRVLPAYERSAVLRRVEAGVLERASELATILASEAGKPIKDARSEVERAAFTFRVAAEEAERMCGEVIPLDLNRASEGRTGITRRFPIGLVAGISPFNLPMGLAVHKVAPAMAVGCPIVLKPPSAAPLTMLAVAEVIEASGALPGSVSVMPMTREMGDRLVSDDRFKLLSFTGSPAVGWAMKARAGKKRVVLELGGNAGVIVDRSADLKAAVGRCAYGAFKYAGQICISVQRIFVHEEVYDDFLESFVTAAAGLEVGDPLDASSDLGPMIDASAVRRAVTWVDEAVASGAKTLLGGPPQGNFFPPTILVDVPRGARVLEEEAFAPVATVAPFSSFAEAIDAVNDSAYGLQAGVFTNDLSHAWLAFERLEVGGVILNDVPTYRIDHMPYGGVKDSGFGREGLRWSVEDMTELRLLVVPHQREGGPKPASAQESSWTKGEQQ